MRESFTEVGQNFQSIAQLDHGVGEIELGGFGGGG